MNKTSYTQPDPNKVKYQSARSNLLLMIILTAVNIVLLFMQSDAMMLFSATIPYFAVIIGMATQIEVILIAATCFAAAIILIYLLCWFMSKRHHGWMITALVMFILDTIAMVLMYLSIGEISGILDIAIHAWVLYYLIVGVKSGKKLKDEPEAVIETTDYEEYSGEDAEAASLESDYGAETDELTESTPLFRAEEDVKHRILLEGEIPGYRIVYRRVKKTNQLVINGWVYAEYEAWAENSHTLEAVVGGQLIEAGLDVNVRSFISVNGKRIADKRRWI